MTQFQMIIGDCVALEGEKDVKVLTAFLATVKRIAEKERVNEIMFARSVRKNEELRKYCFEVARKVSKAV